MRKSMLLSRDLRLPNVVFEGDCLSVVKVATSFSLSSDELSPVIYDVHFFFFKLFSGWIVSYAPRDTKEWHIN